MIKSKLITRIADLYPTLLPRDAEAVVDAILERISKALDAGDRVELRDFGSFTIKLRGARVGRNPMTGAAVSVPKKREISFRASRRMRGRLNDAQVMESAPISPEDR